MIIYDLFTVFVISCDEKKAFLSVCLSACHVNTTVEGEMSILFHILLNVSCVYIFMECLLHSALTGCMKWRK